MCDAIVRPCTCAQTIEFRRRWRNILAPLQQIVGCLVPLAQYFRVTADLRGLTIWQMNGKAHTMAKPNKAMEHGSHSNPSGSNHGSAVSDYVHYLQEQRAEDGEHRGIGAQVSEFASGGKAHGGNEDGGTDNGLPDAGDDQVLLVRDGQVIGAPYTSDTSIQDAIDAAEEGDTIVIGAGTYNQTVVLDKSLNIVGEEGATIDGSGFTTSTSLQSTILLADGFSGGSITNVDVIAVEQGNAVLTAIGDDVTNVTLEHNVFSAGDNTSGSVVYLNPDASKFTFEGNMFEGEELAASPLLGIEADDVTVTGNTFGDTVGTYASVEVFAGNDSSTADVVLLGNVGLDQSEVSIA